MAKKEHPTPASVDDRDEQEQVAIEVSNAERWFALRELAHDKTKGTDAVRARASVFEALESALAADPKEVLLGFYEIGAANLPLLELVDGPIAVVTLPRRLVDAFLRFVDGVIDEGRLPLHEARFLLSLAGKLRGVK